MEQSNEIVIKHLNNILEINNDRIQGYEIAIKKVTENDLKTLFNKFVSHSRVNRNELSTYVILLGGYPTDGIKVAGKIFHAWMDVKAALSDRDRKAILASCETGEYAAISTYDDLLNSNAQFNENIRNTISKQRANLLKAHNSIKNLRDLELKMFDECVSKL